MEGEAMRCKQARQMISQYIDEALRPDEKNAFALHIRDCAACREKLEETRAVQQMFASAGRFSAPYGFATRVLANLEEQEGARPWSLLGLRTFFLRAAQVGFALVVMTMGIISGNLLLADRTSPHGQITVAESFSLDLFQVAPPDSIAGIYVALMGASHER
jgi:anti-sigma factor RsiW